MAAVNCARLIESVGALFNCSPHGGAVRVRTPFLYPDGDAIDIYITHAEAEEVATFSDMGVTLGWLKAQSATMGLTAKQKALAKGACRPLGVEFFRGELSVRCAPGDAADAIVRLGQAALRVSDIFFSMRSRAPVPLADEVDEYLERRGIPKERAVRLRGQSGRDWIVDFDTRADSRRALVFVLSGKTRGAATRATEHVVTGWHDLKASMAGDIPAPKFVSLFDDSPGIWRNRDILLVKSLSHVVSWSHPDDLVRLLCAAA